jgi:predicted negative regulator of RcsB-dependent stress response
MNKTYKLIIILLLITITIMGWKIYDLKQSSEELKQFSVKTGVECIKNSKTMTQEEIESGLFKDMFERMYDALR